MTFSLFNQINSIEVPDYIFEDSKSSNYTQDLIFGAYTLEITSYWTFLMCLPLYFIIVSLYLKSFFRVFLANENRIMALNRLSFYGLCLIVLVFTWLILFSSFYAQIWAFNSISNAFMHATNGNIDFITNQGIDQVINSPFDEQILTGLLTLMLGLSFDPQHPELVIRMSQMTFDELDREGDEGFSELPILVWERSLKIFQDRLAINVKLDPRIANYYQEFTRRLNSYYNYRFELQELDNATMHALNGNINMRVIQNIIDDHIDTIAARQLIVELAKPVTHFEHAKFFRNFDMIFVPFLLNVRFHDLTFSWKDYIDFVQNFFDDICATEHYMQNYRTGSSDLPPINVRLRRGWTRFSNRPTSQMRFPGLPLDIGLDSESAIVMEDFTSILDKCLNKGINMKIDHSISPESSIHLNDLSDTISKISTTVNDTKFNLKIGIDQDSLIDTSAILFLIGSSIYAYSHPSKISYCTLGAAVVFGMSRHGPLNIDFTKFTKYMGVQSQFSTGDLTDVVTSISMMICTYTCKSKPTDSLLKSVVGELLNFQKYTKSLDTILKFSVSAFEKVINLIRRYVMGESSLTFLETGRTDLDRLLARVKCLDDAIHLNKFTYTLENSHLVHTLHQDAIKLLANLPRDRDSAPLSSALNNAISFVFKIKMKMDAMNLNLDGVRQEPCAIMLRGPPGVGKSQAMEHLCYRMLPSLVPEDKVEQALETPQHFIHNRQAENVYWEGFDHEKVITLFDDAGQARDIQGQPDNEFMNVIRAINVFQYNTHMAGIESKGNVKFMSKMVIANTNMPNMEINSIIEPRAYFRRFDLIVDTCPRREYCTDATKALHVWKRELDPSKMPIGVEGITSMHPDILEFHVYDYRRKKLTGEVLNFDGIVEKMKYFNTLKQARFVQYQKELALSKAKPQVDWAVFKSAREVFTFERSPLDERVKHYLRLFIKNPDYKHCSMMLCSTYHRFTGFDHKLEYVVAVFMDHDPYFDESHSWTFEQFAEYLLNSDLDQVQIPVYGVKYQTGMYDKLVVAFSDFRLKCDRFYDDHYPTLSVLPGLLAKLAVVVGVLGTVYSLYQNFQEPTYDAGSEYNKAREQKTKVTFKKPPSMKQAKAAITANSQALLTYDKSNIEIVNKIVSRNVYELILPNNTEHAGFVTFIRGNVFMVNRHFVTLCVANAQEDPNFVDELFTLRKPNTDVKYHIPIKCILNFKVDDNLDDQDVAFVEVPKHIPQHTDIVKYFASRDDLSRIHDLVFRLIIPAHANYHSWVGKAEPYDCLEVYDPACSYIVRKGYRYMAMTESGDCGSLFTLCSTHSNAKKILGIHTAGSEDGYSYSTSVFSEDLEAILKMFEPQIISEMESEAFSQCALPFSNKKLVPLYKHNIKTVGAFKTSKRRSPFYGKIAPVTTAPARLQPFYKDGILVNPMDKALLKFCINDSVIDTDVFRMISDQLYDDLACSSPIDNERRIFTFEEAVLGLENDPTFGSISRSTSAGFPYQTWPKVGKGKSYWFGDGQDFDLGNQACIELKALCEEILEDAKHGIRREHIYKDCLKDEVVELRKMEEGKTRGFSTSPIPLFIVYRRLFGAFIHWCALNKIENGFAVGVNPYSLDWENIAKKMLQKGSANNFGDGDYAGFDGSEIPPIHIECLNVIERYYGNDGYKTARFVMFLELINSKHINGDLVYEWTSSLPSGNPLTTIINNLYNHLCFRYCWLQAHNGDITCLISFRHHVYLITLGDDNAFSVSSMKLDVFNMISIEKHMREIGMKYTSADKKSEIGVMKPLNQISFLKRTFTWSPILFRHIAPLKLESITTMLDWMTNGPDMFSSVESNVRTAFYELALHPREIFDEYSQRILETCKIEHVSRPDSTSYLLLLRTCAKQDYRY